jgi:hypothetical protein
MSTKQVTPASTWRKAAKEGPAPLELPSGNVALVRIPGPQAFLTEGIIPNALLPIIQEVIDEAQKGKQMTPKQEESIADMMRDPEKLRQVFEMADAVTLYCVVEPEVLPTPEDESEKDPELLYVDEVDLDDKLFIFHVAMGGSKDLETFRPESLSDVGGVSGSKDVASSTKRPARARAR